MSEGEESRIYRKTEQIREKSKGKREQEGPDGGKTEQGRGNRDKGKEEQLERA